MAAASSRLPRSEIAASVSTLLDFYHNESRLFGVDTRHRDAVASGALLEALTPVFEQGTFKAPKIDRVIPLSEGRTAYEQVARGEARGRPVLAP